MYKKIPLLLKILHLINFLLIILDCSLVLFIVLLINYLSGTTFGLTIAEIIFLTFLFLPSIYFVIITYFLFKKSKNTLILNLISTTLIWIYIIFSLLFNIFVLWLLENKIRLFYFTIFFIPYITIQVLLLENDYFDK